jgi:hypothetical protein
VEASSGTAPRHPARGNSAVTRGQGTIKDYRRVTYSSWLLLDGLLGVHGSAPGLTKANWTVTRRSPSRAATLHVSDSSGHDVGADRSGEIASVLASHAK